MPSKPSIDLSRRQMIGTGIAGLVATPALAGAGIARDDSPRVLRVAFLTDTHVQPERRGEQGGARSRPWAGRASTRLRGLCASPRQKGVLDCCFVQQY